MPSEKTKKLLEGLGKITDSAPNRFEQQKFHSYTNRYYPNTLNKLPASYDKANRSSIQSFRGPGLEEGLKILQKIKTDLQVPVLSDVHKEEEIDPAAQVLDVLQIPAFLCRQTDLLVKAASTGKPINVKKGQFMAPWDMKNVVNKLEESGNKNILLTERGVTFGYNNLVVDMRSLVLMRDYGYPVVFDSTHSLQQPGGQGTKSGGQREMIPDLARGAVAVGCDALFMEVHPDPDQALSDGPNMLKLDLLPELLKQLIALDQIVRPLAGEADSNDSLSRDNSLFAK